MTSFLTPLPILAALLLAAAFLTASRPRLRSLITLFVIQASALALYAAWLFIETKEVHYLAVAFLILVLKVVLIPSLLLRAAVKSGASMRLSMYLRPAMLSFVSVIAVSAAAYTAYRLPFAGDAFSMAVSFSLILIGFELLITHRTLFGQGIGFLTLENGVFFFGLALAHGVPLVVEAGVLLDLLALLVLATALIRRAQVTHASVATDYLEALNDL